VTAGIPTAGVPGGGRDASFIATAVRSAADSGATTAVTTTCRDGAPFISACTTVFESLFTIPSSSRTATATVVPETCFCIPICPAGAGVDRPAARLGVGPGARLGGALPIRSPSAIQEKTPHAATPAIPIAHCVAGTGATVSRGLTRVRSLGSGSIGKTPQPKDYRETN